MKTVQLSRRLVVLATTWLAARSALADPGPDPKAVDNNHNRGLMITAPSVWVTVDSTGGARTITPVVTTTGTATTTISPPPDNLLKTTTYTLSASGSAVTSTGLAPVATATASTGDAGAFLACSVYQDLDAPFCQPKRGSTLYPGLTYYITWAPSYFADQANETVELQASFGNSTGLTSWQMPANDGFFPWTISSSFLDKFNGSALNVTFSLGYFDTDSTGSDIMIQIPGPTVFVSKSPASGGSTGGTSSAGRALAIAIPVVVCVALAGLLAACCCMWRKTGRVPVLSAMRDRKRKASHGYGERKSRSERVGSSSWGGVRSDKPIPNRSIQLTDRNSWSPPVSPAEARMGADVEGQGRNVFREEVRRQETGRYA